METDSFFIVFNCGTSFQLSTFQPRSCSTILFFKLQRSAMPSIFDVERMLLFPSLQKTPQISFVSIVNACLARVFCMCTDVLPLRSCISYYMFQFVFVSFRFRCVRFVPFLSFHLISDIIFMEHTHKSYDVGASCARGTFPKRTSLVPSHWSRIII